MQKPKLCWHKQVIWLQVIIGLQLELQHQKIGYKLVQEASVHVELVILNAAMVTQVGVIAQDLDTCCIK